MKKDYIDYRKTPNSPEVAERLVLGVCGGAFVVFVFMIILNMIG